MKLSKADIIFYFIDMISKLEEEDAEKILDSIKVILDRKKSVRISGQNEP